MLDNGYQKDIESRIETITEEIVPTVAEAVKSLKFWHIFAMMLFSSGNSTKQPFVTHCFAYRLRAVLRELFLKDT